MFTEIIESLREDSEIEELANAHNLGDDTAFDDLDDDIIEVVQSAIRQQFGDTLTLYHGSEDELAEEMFWNENSSFTDRFDIEFAGEDGYIVEAQIPVERIKFFLSEEREFVITAGALNCKCYTVAEYFDLE
jgi:hypothetical protein